MADPVLNWAGYAQEAQQRYGIPADVLLGLTSVESGGIEGRTSSAGAGGLTQFMPGTARGYGVNVTPGHARSQLLGAAHYLADLGFHRDPEHALNAYNGAQTIAGKPNPYARDVLAAAKRYAGVGAGTPTGRSGGELLPGFGQLQAAGALTPTNHAPGALKALLSVTLVLGGIMLVLIGGGALLGLKPTDAALLAGPEGAPIAAAGRSGASS